MHSLSEQLYKKPTHFLLELIQNADDNTYDDETPAVWFTTRDSPQLLRIDCNEVGFDKSNVEALCRIGFSTKTNSDRTRGFIGEKGIGFKSVFKVADELHISSKAYSFKFDGREMLGMIVPIIEGFPPAHREVGQTQMLLKIKTTAIYTQISDDVQKLDPRILIFLRKLRKIAVSTRFGTRISSIRRVLRDSDFDGGETAILRTFSFRSTADTDETNERYIIVRRTESPRGKDERRENLTSTETVLAFPVDDMMRPLLRSQQTYAHLPIDDHGFHVSY